MGLFSCSFHEETEWRENTVNTHGQWSNGTETTRELVCLKCGKVLESEVTDTTTDGEWDHPMYD